MGAGGGALFQQLMSFARGDFSAFQLAAEQLVGVAETLEERRKKGGEGAGVGKKEVIEFLDVHEVEAGGFEGAGGGGAGLVVEQGHFAEDVPRDKVAEGDVALACHVEGDFDATLEDTERLVAFLAFAEDGFSLAKGFFAHDSQG